MALFRIAEPAVEPVSVADARAWLRIDHEGDDALLGDLIRAARVTVENETGKALIDQQWRLTRDRWPSGDVLTMPRGPVSGILSVVIYDRDGNPDVVDTADLVLDGLSDPARLYFENRPAPGRRMNGIEIDFSCGYGPSGADVPEPLRRAILMLVAHGYEFRGAFRADDQPVSWPDGVLPLLRPYRRARL